MSTRDIGGERAFIPGQSRTYGERQASGPDAVTTGMIRVEHYHPRAYDGRLLRTMDWYWTLFAADGTQVDHDGGNATKRDAIARARACAERRGIPLGDKVTRTSPGNYAVTA